MTITFYNQSSPTNKITKTLGTALGTCTINNIHDINVVNPIFIVKSDALSGSLDNLAKANYVVAGTPFSRSYFITGVDFSTAKTAIVYCHCDVLSTYAGSLGTLNFTRGAGDINEMDDVSYPISDYMIQQHYKFGNWDDIFNNKGSKRQYLLRTIRGQAKTYPTVTISDGGTIWCGRSYDDGGTIKYRCFTINISGDNAIPEPLITNDITGVPQVFPNYKIKVGTKVWRAAKGDSDFDFNPEFYYLGDAGT